MSLESSARIECWNRTRFPDDDRSSQSFSTLQRNRNFPTGRAFDASRGVKSPSTVIKPDDVDSSGLAFDLLERPNRHALGASFHAVARTIAGRLIRDRRSCDFEHCVASASLGPAGAWYRRWGDGLRGLLSAAGFARAAIGAK